MFRLCLFIVALSASAAAADQRSCLFERQTSPHATFAVKLPLTFAVIGRKTTVRIPDSGNCSAEAKQSTNDAASSQFTANVSGELITVEPQGEALWPIDFTDGRTQMHYVGRFSAAQG